MHHFVEQHREIEDRESLHERQRHPLQRVGDGDETPRSQTQNHELPCRDHRMARCGFRMERTQRFHRQRMPELGPQRRRVLTVMVRLHG